MPFTTVLDFYQIVGKVIYRVDVLVLNRARVLDKAVEQVASAKSHGVYSDHTSFLKAIIMILICMM